MTGTFRIGLVESAGFCMVAGTAGATIGQDLSWGLYCGVAMAACLGGRIALRRAAGLVTSRLRQSRGGRMQAAAGNS